MIAQKENTLIQAPPRAIELEEAVNGACMMDVNIMPVLASILAPKHFYDPGQMEVYDACLDLYQRRRPIDLLTVMEELKSRGSLERVGGPAALSELTNRVASTANTEYHARVIIQKWLSRELGKLGTQIARESYSDDPFEIMEHVGSVLNTLSGFQEEQASTIYAAAEGVLEQAEIARENPGGMIGFPLFGYKPLDERLQGVRFGNAGGDVIVITGPSGGGKSSLGNNAIIQCEATGTPIYSWSSEMTKKDQARRFLSGKLGINGIKLANGQFLDSPDDSGRVAGEVKMLENKKIFLDSGRLTLNRMTTTVSFYKRQHGVQIFMFDRIELFDLRSVSNNPVAAQEEFAKKARQLANEFEVTIIIFAQLTKEAGKNGHLQVSLSDIKGAGEITQSATKALYIVRPDIMGIEEDEEGRSLKDIGFIHILKSTHFSRGEVRMRFLETRTRWEMDMDEEKPDDSEYVPNPGYNPILTGYENRNFDDELPF